MLLGLFLTAACAAPRAASQDAAIAELLAADRAFYADTAARGLDGWMALMAKDAVRLDLFGEFQQGRSAIQAVDEGLFANPDAHLEWEPRGAAIFDDLRTGMTHGAYTFSLDKAVLARGVYLTLWRRGAAGRWEVILDTGAPRPAEERHARWTEERAGDWYSLQPWLVGCNFLPSTASNQLEMWQAETWDPATIERELTWAARLGMNTVRTYLHDLAWQADPEGFKQRLDQFLSIAAAQGIRPTLVLFDDCWNDDPRSGPQPEPRPGVHNSCWVRSPGSRATLDPTQWLRLENYVSDVVGQFAADDRVLMWDLYNEPGNSGMGLKSLPLLRAAFAWARAAGPSQPLTAGLWTGGGDYDELNAEQARLSDVISFHNYNGADDLRAQIAGLRAYHRPLICTEWLRRGSSEVATSLAVFASEGVGCLNWGLVRGRSNTVFPWGSPEGTPVPARWFHDLLEPDGRPHDLEEVQWFREFTARVRNAE